MNELRIFEHQEFGGVRALEINGEPWLVGKDVASALGYSNPRDALAKHVDEEDKNTVAICDGIPGNPNQTVINESGLYALVLSSKLPGARKFRRWVTADVLPSIRKSGCYALPQDYLSALRALADAEETRLALEATAEENRPKVIFADAVAASHSSILVGDLAKLIRQNGVEIGQNRLFRYLRDHNYLCAHGERYNLPTQRSMDRGLFEVKETTIANPDGSIRVNRTVKVTGKGQQFFINHFLSGRR